MNDIPPSLALRCNLICVSFRIFSGTKRKHPSNSITSNKDTNCNESPEGDREKPIATTNGRKEFLVKGTLTRLATPCRPRSHLAHASSRRRIDRSSPHTLPAINCSICDSSSQSLSNNKVRSVSVASSALPCGREWLYLHLQSQARKAVIVSGIDLKPLLLLRSQYNPSRRHPQNCRSRLPLTVPALVPFLETVTLRCPDGGALNCAAMKDTKVY